MISCRRSFPKKIYTVVFAEAMKAVPVIVTVVPVSPEVGESMIVAARAGVAGRAISSREIVISIASVRQVFLNFIR